MINCAYTYRGIEFDASLYVSNISLNPDKSGVVTLTVFKQGQDRALTQKTIDMSFIDCDGDVYEYAEEVVASGLGGVVVEQ